MAIKVEGYPISNYKLAQYLKLHPAQTQKRLKVMKQFGILEEIAGWPKFYKFNMVNHQQDFIILTLECPRCKKMHIRHHSQTTVQCTCKTPSGKLTRFYVFESRIKNKRVLERQREKTPEQEKEEDVLDIIKSWVMLLNVTHNVVVLYTYVLRLNFSHQILMFFQLWLNVIQKAIHKAIYIISLVSI